MANLKDVIFLSNLDYNTLATTGTVTIGSDTLTYDANTVYITPDVLASSTENGLMSASDKSKLDSINLSNLVTTNTAQTISGAKTFSNSSAPILTLKRTTASSGAFIDYKASNQDAKFWRLGMGGDEYFTISYSSNNGSTVTNLIRITPSGEFILNNNIALKGRNSSNTPIQLIRLNTNNNVVINNDNSGATFVGGSMFATFESLSGVADLGDTTHKWRDIYLAGVIRNDNASYGLSLPTMSTWTDNKTIATTADIPSTYLKSASVNGNTLTLTKQDNTTETFTDTDTNYYAKTVGTTGLKIGTGYSGSTTSTTYDLYVPYATASQAGVVTTEAQTFAGAKTFSSINISSDGGLGFYNGSSFKKAIIAGSETRPQYRVGTGTPADLALLSDIPSTSNFVTLNGAQTITGVKTFTQGLNLIHDDGAPFSILNENEGISLDIDSQDIVVTGGDGSATLHFPAMGDGIDTVFNLPDLETSGTYTLATQEWVQQQIQAAITAALNTPV